MKIKIKDQEVELMFRFSLLLALSRLWNIPHIEKVIGRLNFAEGAETDDKGNLVQANMPVSFFEDLIDVVKVSAKQAGNEITATDDEIADDLFADMETMQLIMVELVQAMPKVKQSVNPKSRNAKK
jgi:uncharacterized protein YecA (UPF0149 family)